MGLAWQTKSFSINVRAYKGLVSPIRVRPPRKKLSAVNRRLSRKNSWLSPDLQPRHSNVIASCIIWFNDYGYAITFTQLNSDEIPRQIHVEYNCEREINCDLIFFLFTRVWRNIMSWYRLLCYQKQNQPRNERSINRRCFKRFYRY